MILVNKRSNLQILSDWSDNDGRIVQITFNWNDLLIALTSIYAPAVPGERTQFFSSLPTFPLPDDALHILAGDFNCVLDPILDRSGVTLDPATLAPQNCRN